MKKKMGRPKIPVKTDDIGNLEERLPNRCVDIRQVLYWMDLGATQEEIAGAQYISVDTLKRRLKESTGQTFAQLKEKCCGSAKIKLRNNQFKLSEKNASMGIWLGKIWLGQRDVDEKNSQDEIWSNLASFVKECQGTKEHDDTPAPTFNE